MTSRESTEEDKLSPALAGPFPSYESLVCALPVGVIQQDSKGQVIFYNPSAARILGEPVTQSFQTAFPISHEGSEASGFGAEEHPAQFVLRTGKPCSGAILGVRHGPDRITWVCVNSAPLVDPAQGTPCGVLSTITDITECTRSKEPCKRARPDCD